MSQTDLKNFEVTAQYRDQSWLRKKYTKQKMTMEEIAEVCGVSHTTIRHWIGKFDIDVRDSGHNMDGKKYTDRDWLYEKYNQEQMTVYEISRLCDCDHQTILNWLENHGIETRSRGTRGRGSSRWNEWATYLTSTTGYERWQDNYHGEREVVKIHRLAAVAWFGLDGVSGKEIHHRIPIPWLNVESNLLPLPGPEHQAISNFERVHGTPEGVVEEVLEGIKE